MGKDIDHRSTNDQTTEALDVENPQEAVVSSREGASGDGSAASELDALLQRTESSSSLRPTTPLLQRSNSQGSIRTGRRRRGHHHRRRTSLGQMWSSLSEGLESIAEEMQAEALL